jgi:hypothetical protein
MEELYIKKYGDIYPVAEMEAYVQIDYFDRNGLITIWTKENLNPDDYGGFMHEEVAGIIDELFARQKMRMKVVDVVGTVFEELTRRNIVCTHHVGFNGRYGYGIHSMEYNCHSKPARIFGYCYYTYEDMVSAIEGGDLMIRYGSIDNDSDEDEVLLVAEVVGRMFDDMGFELDCVKCPELGTRANIVKNVLV